MALCANMGLPTISPIAYTLGTFVVIRESTLMNPLSSNFHPDCFQIQLIGVGTTTNGYHYLIKHCPVWEFSYLQS